jgi:hypothetical protein
MPTLASEAFGVPHQAFVDAGAFDRFVDLDARLYVDPHLLSACEAPEFDRAYDRFRAYFEDVLVLLRQAPDRKGVLWKTARDRLTFKEVGGVGLGLSKRGDTGSAVGPGLAEALLATAAELVNAGIDDPAVFELAGVLQEDFGPDRISDMTIAILLANVLTFTERVARQLGIATTPVRIRGHQGRVPLNPVHGKPLLLIPMDLLRDLPVAESWDEMDIVAAQNAELRHRVNHIIGQTWKEATENLKKQDLREVLVAEPDLVRDLLAQYKSKPEDPYDLEGDPVGEIRWYFVAKDLPVRVPLDLGVGKVNCGNLQTVVTTICKHFKRLIEDNALSELLYDPAGNPLRERASQRLFYGIADAYCKAWDLDLTAESNAGRGPVDFKVSRGYSCRVNVETKLSKNNLLRGFAKQLPIYDRAEQAYASVLLVLRVHDSMANIKAVTEARSTRLLEGLDCPELLVVDARPQLSASKA